MSSFTVKMGTFDPWLLCFFGYHGFCLPLFLGLPQLRGVWGCEVPSRKNTWSVF